MDNKELEVRIKEIINQENFFDVIMSAKAFEKEYKESDFYKATKMGIIDVIKNAKEFYFIQLDDLFSKLQTKINELDFNKFNELLDQFSSLFATENSEALDLISNFKDILTHNDTI